MAVPEGPQLDPTGQWCWDGNEWQPVEGEAEFGWTDFQPELVMEWEELEDHFEPPQAVRKHTAKLSAELRRR